MSEIAIEELSTRLGEVAVLDVRTQAEFDGSGGKPCDPRQGREQIEAAVGAGPGAEIVAYCHGGSRSAIATQMLRALGYEARNYVGSWHEWSRHDELSTES